MANKQQQMQHLIGMYIEETGKTEFDTKEVAKFAVERVGWKLATPESPLDRLAKEFSRAAREVMRRDKDTGKPYRAYHAISVPQGRTQLHLWIDIDKAPRKPMHKSLMNRREQMVGDGLQLTFDANHWNSIHPKEEPIIIPMDLTPDILWRLNAPDEDQEVI